VGDIFFCGRRISSPGREFIGKRTTPCAAQLALTKSRTTTRSSSPGHEDLRRVRLFLLGLDGVGLVVGGEGEGITRQGAACSITQSLRDDAESEVVLIQRRCLLDIAARTRKELLDARRYFARVGGSRWIGHREELDEVFCGLWLTPRCTGGRNEAKFFQKGEECEHRLFRVFLKQFSETCPDLFFGGRWRCRALFLIRRAKPNMPAEPIDRDSENLKLVLDPRLGRS